MSGSGSSNNTNNTGSADQEFITEVDQSHALRYWVPTASKLSRGKKGIIQRMFTGEPMNNLCNVYIYNETSKLWYHEHTIQGDPSRSGNTTYPPSGSVLTSSSQTLSDGITYTTSASINSGDAYKGFTGGGAWTTNDSSGSTNYYPHNAPGGYVGTWVAGTYVGSSSLGGVSGEWIKMELSTSAQPDEFTMTLGGLEFMEPHTFTILGSNDDSNWTNLGNFTNTGNNFGNPITDTLTISNTYTYFAIVFTKRRTDNWNTGYQEYIEIEKFSLTDIQPSEDFGRSLDGTDNADMVAVGAPGTWFGSVSNISGYARVFTKNSSGNGWTQRGSEVSQQGGFGHSVALSQYDGNILVVGAPFYNTLVPNASGNINFHGMPVSEGKVYIYKWNGANYTLQQTLNSPSGTLSTTTPTTSKNFYFGYSLGITDIGDKIIVGEPSIRNIWYEPDQIQGGANNSWTTDSFPYTGNAHVYDNVTVLSGGSSWTSNVSMTSVIGTTGIGTTYDTNPLKVRWLDALGTSVDINRAGTRILAGGPGSYGTSNTAPHAMSGRIYTLDWDPIDAEWKEMGEVAKHIVAPQGNMLLGKTARFDGSGRRIVSGATGYVAHITYNKGNVLIFDFNGDQWVSFPNEVVELAGSFFYWTNYQHKLGESISIDGEGEMVAIGKSEIHYDLYNPTASPAAQVSGGFTVDNITYIGGATTSVAGSDSQISTGGSTIWVYNISQSMVIKGNVTIGGYIQGTGISIGTNDDSSTSNKSIYFGGSKSDNAYELTVIENRVYEAEEKAELLLFKGNDNADASGGGTYGPDRIRLKGGQIVFDLNAGYDRTAEDIRAVMHRNAGGAGMLGINVTSPTEVIHVDGKIKATQGFIGRGTELTGLNFNYINNVNDLKFGQAGATQSSTTWGEITLGSSIVYPTLALNSNSQSGYTVSASTDSVNAWKAFNDVTSGGHSTDVWEIGADATYSNSTYIGSTERVSGYKGEWIEIQLPNPIYVEKLDIYVTREEYQPRRLHMFGSNDGVTYDLIQYSGDLGDYWLGSDNAYGTVFTRTPDVINESPYNRILMIVNGLAGGSNAQYWKNINIYGKIGTFTPNVKLDYTGKIGILNANPSYPLDVTGDINLTGDLRIGGVAQSFGGGGGSSVWSLNSTNAYYNSGNVGIGTSTPASTLDVNGTVNLTSLLIPTYIIHKNDTNTYFGFPSDDTFIINTNGTERLRANSSGNVGIGTTSPGYKLDVDGDINMSSGSSLRINGVAQSFGSGSPVWSLNSTNAYYNSGNVGIGTSSPGYKLDVDGDINMSSGSSLRINGVAQSFGGFSGDIADYITHTSDSDTKFGFPSNDTFTITTANGERFRITSSGDVGIGNTANSGYKLDVSGTGRFTSSLSASSFTGSGSGLTSLSATNISTGTLAVARGGTNISSYTAGDMLYYSGSTLSKLGIGSAGEVLTVAGNIPSWAAASGGGGGATAGTVTMGDDGMNTITVSGSAYDYMYHQSPHNIGSSSSNFNSISISQAMTHGQKLIMKLYTNSSSCQAKIARSRDLSVTINSTGHTISNSNFRENFLSFPYDSDPTPNKFLILEITKEDTNKVSIEAKLSTADFTKTAECDAAWSYDGIDTNNRETAIHNVIYSVPQSIYGTPFKFRFSYFGIGHSHDIYFLQDHPSGLSIPASQIEFYYNNSSTAFSQASQTNVFTNFDKNTNLEFTYGKYYHIHHEVIRNTFDDYPRDILFTVEELNTASGGGGGGGGGASDFTTNITRVSSNPPIYRHGIEISSSFSAANYNYNTGFYDFNMNGGSYPPFETFIIDHTLPTSMPIEYDFYFTGYSANISSNYFKVYYGGMQRNTYHSFPGTGSTSFNFNSSDRYSVSFKSRDTSGSDWTATWKIYKY
jgi:hypothetical protein